MGKLTNKQGRELVDAGIITQDAFDTMQEEGQIGSARKGGGSTGPKRVFAGTEVSPQMYFKGGKGIELNEDMRACRDEVNEVIEKYTVLA